MAGQGHVAVERHWGVNLLVPAHLAVLVDLADEDRVAAAAAVQPASVHGGVGVAGLGVGVSALALVGLVADQFPPLGVGEGKHGGIAAGSVQQRPQLRRGVGGVLPHVGLGPTAGHRSPDPDVPDDPPFPHHPIRTRVRSSGMTDRETAAAASIAGLAQLYAHSGRLTWDTALQEIRYRLQAWEIRPKRIGEVMSIAATGYVDSDAWRADLALQLLVDAGADVERARVIRAQVPPRRVVGAGRATPNRALQPTQNA